MRPQGYAPRVLEGADLPPISGRTLVGGVVADARPGVLVGGFDLESLIEQDVWRRLLDGASSAWVHAVFQPSWSDADAESFRASVPPSRWGSTWMAEDDRIWRSLISPDRPGRAFAFVRGVSGVFLVVGKPDEDAWGAVAARLPPLLPPG